MALDVGITARASEREVDYIEGLVSDASYARYVDLDGAAYGDAKTELRDTSLDPEVTAECRLYADVAVTMFDVIELTREHPDSVAVKRLGDSLAVSVATVRNDCLLAI